MKSKSPTLRSIAEEAGVSAMTVSLALRNRREIPFSTRRRIQRIAHARGYRPDPTISKLMQHLRMKSAVRGDANICGLVEAVPTDGSRWHRFTERIQMGLRKRAQSLGFDFNLVEIQKDASRRSLQGALRNRGVEGLVLLPMPGQRDLEDLVEWRNYSVVAVTASVVAPRVHSVTPNHYDNTIKACQELAKDGFRRIGLAISHDWDERVRHRWAGAVSWQNVFGGTESVPPFLGAVVGPKLKDPLFTKWLKAERPDVILVEEIDDDLLNHSLQAVPANRRPVVATMDWPSSRATCGMDQRPEEIGSMAMDILAGMVYRGERGIPPRPLSIMVEGDWVSDLP